VAAGSQASAVATWAQVLAALLAESHRKILSRGMSIGVLLKSILHKENGADASSRHIELGPKIQLSSSQAQVRLLRQGLGKDQASDTVARFRMHTWGCPLTPPTFYVC
jgi:hypothetical protein